MRKLLLSNDCIFIFKMLSNSNNEKINKYWHDRVTLDSTKVLVDSTTTVVDTACC